MQFRTTVTFEDLAGGRTRITLHAVFPSAAERDRVVREYGADKGAEQTLARLADYVATLSLSQFQRREQTGESPCKSSPI